MVNYISYTLKNAFIFHFKIKLIRSILLVNHYFFLMVLNIPYVKQLDFRVHQYFNYFIFCFMTGNNKFLKVTQVLNTSNQNLHVILLHETLSNPYIIVPYKFTFYLSHLNRSIMISLS